MVRAFSKGRRECGAYTDECAGVEMPLVGTNPIKWLPVVAAFLSYGLYLWLGNGGLVVSLLVTVSVALAVVTFDEKRTLTDLVSTIAACVYPQLFLALFYVLNHNTGNGLLLLVIVLGSSIMTDTMALAVGMTFRGPKLCPKISPKKTISGAVGGVIGGILGSLLAYMLFTVWGVFDGVPNVEITTLHANQTTALVLHIAIGFVAGVADQLGDLAASIIKRKTGLKDYSKIFPGHGGVMDRMDGMSFVLVTVYLFATIFGL